MECPNCKKQLSCGCQRKVASDSTNVCSGCISQYENKLKLVKSVSKSSNNIIDKNAEFSNN